MKIFTSSLQRKKKHFAMMVSTTELPNKQQQHQILLNVERQQTPLLLTEPTLKDGERFEMTNNEPQDAFRADDDVSLSMILSHFPPRSFEDDSFSFSSQDDEAEEDFMMESEQGIPLDIPMTLTIDFSKSEVFPGYKETSKTTSGSVKKCRRAKHTRRLKSISPR